MQAEHQRMPARYFALLYDLLSVDGMDVDAALEAAGVWPTQLRGPDASLSTQQFEALIAQLEDASGRKDLGFLLGHNIKLSSHEILGFAILTSPTLDYAVRLAARYYRLITPAFHMLYRPGTRQSEIHFQPALSLNPRAFRFLLETVVVTTYEQMNALLQGGMPGCDIYVSYSEPAYLQHYRQLRPAEFHFAFEDKPGARMVFDSALLSQRLPLADKASLEMAESRCEQLIKDTSKSRQMSEWVCMMLRESTNGFPTLAELAKMLNQSSKTLDRQLQREGQRFLELSKRIRHEKACALLQAGQQSISQIALQLGYNETASFSRAFRRESGCSPSEYLQRQPVGSSD